MLLEGNQLRIGVISAIVIAIGTAIAIFASGGLLKPGMDVAAEFADVAGLKSGSFVYVAGVRSGEVLGVERVGDAVKVNFKLKSGGVPKDSSAAIIVQNTLGERAIQINPGASSEFFSGGETIPISRTKTPIDLPELGDKSAELLGELNTQALQDLTTALADVVEGKREQVDRLLNGIDQVTAILSERRAELGTLIARADVLIGAAADKDQELIRVIDGFGVTLNTLAERRQQITTLLESTASVTNTSADLIEERRQQIDDVLASLRGDLDVVDRHHIDLAHGLAYMGVAIDGFASIGYRNGEAQNDNPEWGNVFTTNLGDIGVEGLLGCGGVFDDVLTEAIGPDPACEGEPTPANEGESAAAYPGAEEFFLAAGGEGGR